MKTVFRLISPVHNAADSASNAIKTSTVNNQRAHLTSRLKALFGQTLKRAIVSNKSIGLIMSSGSTISISAQNGRICVETKDTTDVLLETASTAGVSEPLTLWWDKHQEIWAREQIIQKYVDKSLIRVFTDGYSVFLYFATCSYCLEFTAVHEEDASEDFLYWSETT